MKFKTLLLILVLTFFSCNNSDDNESKLPECFQLVIDSILEKAPTQNRASISLYSYNNQMVYVVDAPPSDGAADFESFVRDENCNLICTLGGLDGEPSPECSDFNESAEFIETVWTDPR